VFHGRLHKSFRRRPSYGASARCAWIGPAGAPVFQFSGQVWLEKESCGGYAITSALALAFALPLAGKVELA